MLVAGGRIPSGFSNPFRYSPLRLGTILPRWPKDVAKCPPAAIASNKVSPPIPRGEVRSCGGPGALAKAGAPAGGAKCR
jgi:hypothetical protein